MIGDFVRIILSDIKKRKLSSFLTLLAISFGILSIFVIALLSQGFEGSMKKTFEEMNGNKIFIEHESDYLYDIDLKNIRNKPFIDVALPFDAKRVYIKHNKEVKQGRLIGTHLSTTFFETYNKEVEFGRAPKATEKYSIAVGPKFAKEFFKKELEVGSNIYVEGYKLKVVGIFESLGTPDDDGLILVSLDFLRDLYGENNKVGEIQASLVEGYDPELAKKNIKQMLENKYGKDTIEVVTPAEVLKDLEDTLGMVNNILSGIAFITLVVGALGIITTMYVIVAEKTKDIGIMKSVGATNNNILFLYMLQAGTFGFLGAIIGTIVGSGIVLLFEVYAKSSGFTLVSFSIDPLVVVQLIFFGFVIGVVSGYIPARKASKMNVVEALRK